jgi:transcription initiation factor TFIIB
MNPPQAPPPASNVQVVLDDVYDPQEAMCKDCGDEGNVVEDAKEGQLVCLRCGVIVGDRVISEGSEWRTFGDGESSRKDDPQRTGGPESELLAELGLSTMIGTNSKNPGDDWLNKSQSRDSLESHHRTLLDAFMKISQMGGRLTLPRAVITKAQELYKRIVDSKELKNRKGEALQAVCLYMAWKLQGVPRTIKELCSATGVRKRDVSRLYSKIKKLKLYKKTGAGATTGGKKTKASKVETIPQSAVFMDRFCSQLAIPRGPTNHATEIAKRVASMGLLEGKQPQTIAGAAIFMVCQLASAYKKTFQEIGDVTGMAPGTLRQAYHILWDSREALVPEGFVPKEVVTALQLNPPGF